LLALSLPECLWLHGNGRYCNDGLARRIIYFFHILVVVLGLFKAIGGTYGTGMQVKQAYVDGTISAAYSCADNSNS
jgi:hypothetical protein